MKFDREPLSIALVWLLIISSLYHLIWTTLKLSGVL